MAKRRSSRAWVAPALTTIRAGIKNLLASLPGDRPERIVVDLSGSFPARAPRRPPPWLPLPPELAMTATSLEELAKDIESLADATWLRGVTFRVHDLAVGPATAWALRRAVGSLASAGKDTTAMLNDVSMMGYYVASAAREIVAPPCADVNLRGFGLNLLFARDLLDKIGVRFEKLQVAEYKSAFDGLVRSAMSDAQREQLDAILGAIEERFVSDVAASRGKKREDVRALLDEGATSASRLAELGFVDRVAYEDEILNDDAATIDACARMLPVRAPKGAKRVAVVSLAGAIIPGRSRRSPLFGGGAAGSETVIQTLRAAANDPLTGAIVFHIDSGGGSAMASDLIGREVERVGRLVPVVAVMGDVAASGGYYVATHARKILAAPFTITGSIGVLTGKLVLEGLYERLGVRAERVSRGRFAHLFDPSKPFTDDERASLEKANKEIYQRFLARVAAGRNKTTEEVDAIAKGRVWSGADARALGLVDELGDVAAAIERAAELAGLPRGAPSYNVRAPAELLLPTADDPTTLVRLAAPLLRERSLLLSPLCPPFAHTPWPGSALLG